MGDEVVGREDLGELSGLGGCEGTNGDVLK